MSVIILTTGVPGCGKTYVRAARFLVDDFLINSRGIHISNFPLNIEAISQDVADKINGKRSFFSRLIKKQVTPEHIAKRIFIIPDDVLQTWRDGSSGPWDFFSKADLRYAHIAIDEIHNFVNFRTPSTVLKKWDDFLGEIRHRGCTFEGVTQDFDQVDDVLSGRASIRLELIPGEDLRDPFFKIKMADWYELKASFLGSYHKTVFMYEKRKSGFGRWVINHTSRFLIVPEYFKYYNSFSASLQEKEEGGSDSDRSLQYEFQRRSRISLLFWFIRRNFWTLFLRSLIAIFVIWLCFGGGLSFFISRWLDVSKSMHTSNSKKMQQKSKVFQEKSSAGAAKSSAGSPDQSSAAGRNAAKVDKELLEKKELLEAGFKPALFFDGKCWLRNGIRISEGYLFNNKEKHGVFYGKTVKKIDQTERNFTLSDDTIIDMF